MKTNQLILLSGMFAVAVMAVAPSAQARQVTGVLRSPSATTTSPGTQLPAPDRA